MNKTLFNKIKKAIKEIEGDLNWDNYTFIQIDENKSNVPIFIFHIKIGRVWNLKNYYKTFLVYKFDKKFFANQIGRLTLFDYTKKQLYHKYNKNLEYFSKKDQLKNFFFIQSFKRAKFLDLIEKDEISKLSWIRVKRHDRLFENAIFLENKKISHISLNTRNFDLFLNYLNIRIKAKKENIEEFYEDSQYFEIRSNIFKFSNHFIKKKISEIKKNKKKVSIINFSFNNNQHYVTQTLGFANRLK